MLSGQRWWWSHKYFGCLFVRHLWEFFKQYFQSLQSLWLNIIQSLELISISKWQHFIDIMNILTDFEEGPLYSALCGKVSYTRSPAQDSILPSQEFWSGGHLSSLRWIKRRQKHDPFKGEHVPLNADFPVGSHRQLCLHRSSAEGKILHDDPQLRSTSLQSRWCFSPVASRFLWRNNECVLSSWALCWFVSTMSWCGTTVILKIDWNKQTI